MESWGEVSRHLRIHSQALLKTAYSKGSSSGEKGEST
jgi:hypothetical protein